MSRDVTIATVVSEVLESLCNGREGEIGALAHCSDGLPAAFLLQDYVKRIEKYWAVDEWARDEMDVIFTSALIYLDRLQRITLASQPPQTPFHPLSIHRAFLTAVLLATKFHEDTYYKNEWYARVGGVSTQELNTLELNMLFSLEFSLNITPDDYAQYFSELTAQCEFPNSQATGSEAAGGKRKFADPDGESSSSPSSSPPSPKM